VAQSGVAHERRQLRGVVAFLFFAAVAAQPSAEALQLGRQVAEVGALASFVELVQAKETDELVEAHPELSERDRATLRATAHRVYLSGRERLMDATGRAYAERLGIDDLRAIVAFQRSPVGQNYRAAIPAAIAATVETVGEMDFKGDVLAAYCKGTGKLCSK
jgi:hypothetical protein